MRSLLLSVVVGLAGCATGSDDSSKAKPGDASADTSAAVDSNAPLPDAGAETSLDSTPPGDATTPSDAAADAPAESGGALDPDLDVPASGTSCSTPGSSSVCKSLEVCRIASATGGRCQSCTSCGNLHASCATSEDCDILFQCYQGTCRNICPLGTSYCGPVANCLDVGNATYGVCKN